MRFVELFAGIGGFRLGLERQGHECVWSSEWLKRPRGIYEYNFGEKPDERDITTVPSRDVPDADLIVGGFPCATFSVAGKRTGFSLADTRGTLCFEMFRIAGERGIPYIMFENVKGLLNHDSGRTFAVILSALDEMGYDSQWELLDSQHFGVPQHRERVFLIANLRGQPRPKVFPLREPTENDNTDKGLHSKQIFGSLQARMRKGLGNTESRVTSVLVDPLNGEKVRTLDEVIDKITDPQVKQWRRGYFRDYHVEGVPTLTANMGTGGNNVPFVPVEMTMLSHTKSNMKQRTQQREASWGLDTSPQNKMALHTKMGIRRLTPLECERLQGLPDNFTKHRLQDGKVIENPDSERYERCGRTVTIPVIEAIGQKLGKEWYA